MVTSGQIAQKNDILLNVGFSMQKMRIDADKTMSPRMKKLATQAARLRREIGHMQNDMKRNRVEFAGWAMSIMFFGMAINRINNQIRQFGVKTFREINESVEGTVNNFMMLEGSMKYLGFTIGQALEPMAGHLIWIVDLLARMIEKNPKLFAMGTIFMTIVGTLSAVAGAAVLAFNGFLDLGIKLGWVKLKADGAIESMLGINKVKIKKALTNALGGIKGNLDWIRRHPIKDTLFTAGVVTGIVVVLALLNRMRKNMGGWGELFKNIGRGAWQWFAGPIYGMMIALAKQASFMWDRIRGKREKGEFAPDFFKDFMSGFATAQKEAEMIFGEPLKGYADESTSLADIWKGEIYPEVEATMEAMKTMEQSAANIANMQFTFEEIGKLFSLGLLDDQQNIGALLYGEQQDDQFLDDKSVDLLRQLLQNQGTTSSVVIQDMTINSDATSIEEILESLKAFS